MWRSRSADVRVWRFRSAGVRVWRSRFLQVWGCEDVDLQIWGCEDVDQHMWGCEDVDLQMWGCEDVKMWRSRSAGVRVWRRSADVKVWRCRSADVKVWRCSITAAFLRRTLRRRSREKWASIPNCSFIRIRWSCVCWHGTEPPLTQIHMLYYGQVCLVAGSCTNKFKSPWITIENHWLPFIISTRD